MLRFTYEGEKYSTEEYRLSECGFFYLVPAELISVTLASVMDELIIPKKDCYDCRLEENQQRINEMLEESQRLLRDYEEVGRRIDRLDEELGQNQESIDSLRQTLEEPEVRDCWDEAYDFIVNTLRSIFRKN